jgi:ribonuclease VapC
MVIDTSAIVAILLAEPEADRFAEAIAKDATRLCSAVNFLEASIVIESRRGAEGLARFDLLIAEADFDIVPFTLRDARAARRAYRRFGKRSHAAALNFGDCAAYALANETGEPLLFKGDDFAKTDVSPAL